MIGSACFALLLLGATDQPPPPLRGGFRMRMRERIIVRVPVRTPPEEIEWREKKGPRCLPIDELRGAAMTKAGSVDLILRGGARIRAELDSECPALDFYSGFYVRSREQDAMICSDRDNVHARSGGECGIERFRKLEPKIKR